MSQVRVTLPSDLQQFVDDRVATGAFDDPGAYLRALAERDRADIARVQALIDEGLASGVCEQDAFAVLDGIAARSRTPNG